MAAALVWLAAMVGMDADTLWLPPAVHIGHYDTSFLQRWPLKAPLLQSPAGALEHFSALAVRNYTLTGLAAISFRGTKADHSELRWNGVPLNSPMNGTADLSWIRNPLFDGVGVRPSDAVPGAVIEPYLRAPGGTKGEVGFHSVLSYDAHTGVGRLDVRRRRAVHQLRAYGRAGRYDFRYVPSPPSPKPWPRLAHNDTREWGVVHQSEVVMRREWLIRGFQWHQQNFYSLASPPGVTYSLRTIRRRHHVVGVRAAKVFADGAYSGVQSITYGFLHYFDSASGTSDTSIAWRIRQHHTLHRRYFREEIWVDFPVEYQQGGHPNYGGVRRRWWAAPRLKYAWHPSVRWWFEGEWSFQFENVKYYLPAPSLAAEYRHYWGSIRLAYRAGHKVPNLNDLYWRPGGNPSLRAEYFRWAEVVARLHDERYGVLKASLHRGRITDWIAWYPDGGVWRAQNLREVVIDGFDLYGEGRFPSIDGMRVDLTFGCAWAREAGSKHQLIYMPRTQAALAVYYETPKAWLKVGGRYVSKRYTTSTNTQWLEPYVLVGAWGGVQWEWGWWWAQVVGGVENLTNTSYETMKGMPMPARTFSVGLKVGRRQYPFLL